MKISGRRSLAFSILIVIILVTAQLSSGGSIVNSKHDFSLGGGSLVFKYDTQDVCVFCHTPHGANPDVSVLWNRTTLSSSAFNTYSSVTFDAGTTLDYSASKFSLMCLSCHDGVTAINSVLQNPADLNLAGSSNIFGPDTIGAIGANSVNIGNSSGDLSNDHPVGFVYNANLVDADRVTSGYGSNQLVVPGQVQAGFVGDPVDKVRLYGVSLNRMECPTCHDPHDPDNGAFLVIDNSGSALCYKCHIK